MNIRIRVMQNPHFQNVVPVFRCGEEQTDIQEHFSSTPYPCLWLGFLLKSSFSADVVDARPSLYPHSWLSATGLYWCFINGNGIY